MQIVCHMVAQPVEYSDPCQMAMLTRGPGNNWTMKNELVI